MLRSERHGTKLVVFNVKGIQHIYTRMNRSENYYQLPYSKVTVSKVTSCSVNRKDKLALSVTVTDHSRLSASRSERGKDTTLDHCIAALEYSLTSAGSQLNI